MFCCPIFLCHVCSPVCTLGVAPGRFATQLQALYTRYRQKSRYLVRNGSERDWRPSLNCDAVTSTPAPFLPYQPTRPPLLIELAASQSLVEIDCMAVSITSSTPRCPTLWFRPVLVIYLLCAFLI